MTVNVGPREADFATDGATTVWAIPFQFLQDDDLAVSLIGADGSVTVLTEGSGYTISGDGPSAAASLTRTPADASGKTLRVRRVTARSQETEYVPNDPFPAAAHETALDRGALIDQEQDDDLTRTLRVPVGESLAELASAATRENKFLQFSADGLSLSLLNSTAMAAALSAAILAIVPAGPPGGNAMSLGLATNIHTLNLNSGLLAGVNTFQTDGYRFIGDGGGAFYYRNTGSAQPGDQVSLDGVRLSLTLNQVLTHEQLGMPTTGWIGTASIAGANLTVTNTQSGALAVGQTLCEAGGGTSVSSDCVITGGAGTAWTVSPSQGTVTSRVMVANDSTPYMAAANQLGVHGLLSVGPHWFSETPVIQGNVTRWYGPSGYAAGGNNLFRAKWYVPAGYGALAAVPNNATVNAQGDVSIPGSVSFGGASGWSVQRIFFQVGNGNLPAATVNNRPGIGIYIPGSIDNWQIAGSDGDGFLIQGNAPTNLADKVSITNYVVSNAFGNGGKTIQGDANTCYINNGVIAVCGASAVWEDGFLGNYWGNPQAQNTGQVNAIVRRTNNLYYSIIDANVGNDPATSPNAWALLTSSTGSDTWSNTTTYQVGVSYRFSGGGNRSTLDTAYTEGGSPPPLLEASSGGFGLTTVLGGSSGAGAGPVNAWSGFSNGDGRAHQFNAYANDGTLGFAHNIGSSSAVGFSANNLAGFSAGPGALAVFATGMFGTTYAWLTSKGLSGNQVGVLAGFTNSGTVVDMLYWDATASQVRPPADATFTFGTSAFRWSDVRSVLINGALGGVSADHGDAAATLTVGTSSSTQLWNTPLTAARAVTLSTTGAAGGHKFRIVRGAGATGAFNLNVGTGPLKALTTAGTWVDVEYSAVTSAWIVTASGSL